MNRIGALTLALCLLCSLALSGCGKKEETGKDVLVTVNGQPIKTQDLQIAWNSMPDEQRKDYNSPKGIINLLDELVSYKLMEIEAQNRKLDQDPLFLKRMEVYRQRLLVNALIEQSMSDADLMNFFQSNFLHARFIRAAFPNGATDAQKAVAKAKADQALAFLGGGGSFDDAIKKFSNLRTGETGDMGYFTHQVIENMTSFGGADALFNLKEPGQHTGIIEGKDGWYIFELVEAPGKLDVRGLTPALASAIRDDRREQVIRSLATELKSRKEFKTVRNQDNLDDLMKAYPQSEAAVAAKERLARLPAR